MALYCASDMLYYLVFHCPLPSCFISLLSVSVMSFAIFEVLCYSSSHTISPPSYLHMDLPRLYRTLPEPLLPLFINVPTQS